MRKDWTHKTLGEIGNIMSGKSIPASEIQEKFNYDKNYPCYGGNGIRGYVNKYIYDGIYPIIGRVGALCGNVHLTNGKFYPTEHALIMFIKGDENPKFIFYLLTAVKLHKYAKGVAQPVLSATLLSKLPVLIPSIVEQERIVSELDLLSGIIDKQKAQLKELDNLAQSIFYDMFGDPVENEKGWETTIINNICSSIVRGPFGSALKKEYFVEPSTNTYKVYEQKHAIQKNAYIGSYYIDNNRFQMLKRFELVVGDIIMSCSGTIGEFFEIPIGAEKGIMNQALLKFTLDKKRINKLYFLFAMDFVKEKFEKKGTGLKNIGSVGTIKVTSISLPPIDLQNFFAEKIENIEKQKESITRSIAETQQLFDSRMAYYFTN